MFKHCIFIEIKRFKIHNFASQVIYILVKNKLQQFHKTDSFYEVDYFKILNFIFHKTPNFKLFIFKPFYL